MRTTLRQLCGQRLRFRATVGRSGTASGWKGSVTDTVLIHDVRTASEDQQVTDHLWFKCGVWSRTLQEGCIIEFDARVGWYRKGYYHDQIDYHLTRPTRLEFVGGKPPLEQPPHQPNQRTVKAPKITPPSTERQREFIRQLQQQAHEFIPAHYDGNKSWQRDPVDMNVAEASALIDDILPAVQEAQVTQARAERDARNTEIAQRLATGEPATKVAEIYGLKPATVRSIARERRLSSPP